ncbi:MAG TPA: ABC transporter permease [Phycisphaerae bacterium]|nr:ABC transporter permease [Phycisphaerae bacterium]
MSAILALVVKDLRLLLRDKAGFIFAFVFPLVYAIFFGAIFSNVGGEATSKLRVAVVDEDGSEESRSFVESLTKTSQVEAVTTSREEAVESVRHGRRLAYITLPKGFGARRDGMFWGDPPNVAVGIDPSRQAEAAMLQGILIRCSFERMQDMFQRPEVMAGRVDEWMKRVQAADDISPAWRAALELFFPAFKSFVQNIPRDESGNAASQPGTATGRAQSSPARSSWQPVAIDVEPVARQAGAKISSYAWSFPQGIIWGVIGCAAAFGISLVVERTNGTLVRLRTAPIARWQILAGKAGACFVTTVCMTTALLLLAAFVFNVRPQSVWLLVMAVVSVALGFVGIMMLLSVLGKTEQSAGGIGWAVLLVMAMLGGGMVPRIFMPSWMQMVSHISPVKWAIHAMEGALWRGFSPAEMAVPCAVLIGVGLACFALGVRAFRWSN